MTAARQVATRIAERRVARVELRRCHEAMVTRADARATELRPIIEALLAAGITTQKGLARALNDAGVATTAGRGKWHASQVRNVLDRLDRLAATDHP